MTQTHFHLIEQFCGKFAHRGIYKTAEEAQKEQNRLKSLYPEIDFFIEQLPTKKKPFYINV